MTSNSALPIDVRNGVATVTLLGNSASQALTAETIQTMIGAAREIRARTEIRAVVLTGSAKMFSSGIDLDFLREINETPMLERRQLVRLGPDMCNAWAAIEVPTIAAIEGSCVGGGIALALSCDFRVLSESAILRLPEVALGLSMSWHSLPKLVALVGPAKAKRMAMAGEAIDANTALNWGLSDQVTAAGEALTLAQAWAADLANMPPLAVRMTKENINAISHALAPLASHMDRDQFILTQASDDLKEGLDAWLSKRPPTFYGR